jgi:hypothetical protein
VRIPATDFETKQLIRRINIEVRDEEANAADAVNTDVAIAMGARDIVTREEYLKLWQARLTKLRLKTKPRRLQDHERLAQLITVPPVPTFGKIIDTVKNWFIPKVQTAPGPGVGPARRTTCFSPQSIAVRFYAASRAAFPLQSGPSLCAFRSCEVVARNRTSRVTIATAAFTTSRDGDTLCVWKT